MSGYVVAPEAQADLLEIWYHYANDVGDPDLADRLTGELTSVFRKLAQTPGIGHFRSDLSTEPLRFWPVRGYLVIYRSEARPVEIVRVFHGARDVQALLGM